MGEYNTIVDGDVYVVSSLRYGSHGAGDSEPAVLLGVYGSLEAADAAVRQRMMTFVPVATPTSDSDERRYEYALDGKLDMVMSKAEFPQYTIRRIKVS